MEAARRIDDRQENFLVGQRVFAKIKGYQAWPAMVTSVGNGSERGCKLELITFEILAAERLRLMGFDNRLIIDCFANVVNILIWLFSTNDRLRSAKYESNYLENPFPEIKGVNLLSKTHRNDKSNLRPMTVLQE